MPRWFLLFGTTVEGLRLSDNHKMFSVVITPCAASSEELCTFTPPSRLVYHEVNVPDTAPPVRVTSHGVMLLELKPGIETVPENVSGLWICGESILHNEQLKQLAARAVAAWKRNNRPGQSFMVIYEPLTETDATADALEVLRTFVVI